LSCVGVNFVYVLSKKVKKLTFHEITSHTMSKFNQAHEVSVAVTSFEFVAMF